MKKIIFLTGTRADYGKIKSLIKTIEASRLFELHVFVTGMHMSKLHGETWREVLRDGYEHIHLDHSVEISGGLSMSQALAQIMMSFTRYVTNLKPDLIVVHGDRIEATAGALVSVLNNVRLAHIEGGEISGTIDESLRHAISKLANEHLVASYPAKEMLVRLGENPEHVHVIGSPDIDVMFSDDLPTLEEAKAHYEITFDQFSLALFHPTTTQFADLPNQAKVFVDVLLESGKNYVVIYPNNDLGYEIILEQYQALTNHPRFRLFPSIRFEYFLALMKVADFVIGNSSAGVRESCVYGVPSIDIGGRQAGRYQTDLIKNIQHCTFEKDAILQAINAAPNYRIQSSRFGEGRSSNQMLALLKDPEFWQSSLQKQLCYD